MVRTGLTDINNVELRTGDEVKYKNQLYFVGINPFKKKFVIANKHEYHELSDVCENCTVVSSHNIVYGEHYEQTTIHNILEFPQK